MPTSNMSLNTPSVGVTAGPDWATQNNENFEILDTHDHTSGKGAQLTPSSLNINADLEFNQNSVTEVKNLTLDNTIHSSASGDTNVSVYVFEGNLYYRNNSGVGVQITNASSLNSTGGAITSPSTNSQVLFSSVNNSYTFKYDKTQTDGIAKIVNSDIQLYFYNNGSATTRSVNLKYTGSGTGSNTLTVPDETGTLLSTATNFAGTINIATSSSNAPINLKPNGTGSVAVGNGGATGKLTSNGAFDLVLDTNSGTNSGTITITDGVNGEITLDTNGTGDINLTAGADVNIPSGIGLTFGNDGEKIEGNGTKLDIAASELDFSIESGGDINIGTDIGLTFGDDGEKIEGDGTDLTIASSGEININSGTLDLSAQTVDVTLNNAVDALNFDSNTLSIDASNNRIGIGTAAPSKLLSLEGTTNASMKIENTGNGPSELILDANRSAEGNGIGSIIYNWNGTIISQITSFAGADTSNKDDGELAFFTTPSGGSLTERMRIDSSGNLGIGTDSPNYTGLQIHGTSNQFGITNSTTGSALTDGFGIAMSGLNAQLINKEAGYLALYTSDTERMRIDSSGNVGIGTTSPTSDGGTTLEIYNTNTPTLRLNDGGDYKALFQLRGNDTEIRGSSGNMEFYTGNVDGASSTERMRIDSSGNVHVARETTGWAGGGGFRSDGSLESVISSNIAFRAGRGTSTGTIIEFKYNNAVVGTISTNGSSTSYNTSSDYRLKENIHPLTDAVDRLNQLKPSRFNFIADPDTIMDGFLAHEVYDYVPEAVSGEKDQVDEDGEIKAQGIDQSKLIPLIVASIQELSAKVTALEGA